MSVTRAEWQPGWYELDQAIAVGTTAEFAFFPPLTQAKIDMRLLFYNTLWVPENAVVATGSVVCITHPKLGQLQRVETRGLDYTFVLPSGTELVVNAEEEPGRLYEKTDNGWLPAANQVDCWTLEVELANLTELKPALGPAHPARRDA